jgi:hypothetical protein
MASGSAALNRPNWSAKTTPTSIPRAYRYGSCPATARISSATFAMPTVTAVESRSTKVTNTTATANVRGSFRFPEIRSTIGSISSAIRSATANGSTSGRA